MVFDLKRPLKQCDKLSVTLEFEKAGKTEVSFDVQGVGAPGPAAAPMDMKKTPDHSGMNNVRSRAMRVADARCLLAVAALAVGTAALASDDFFTHLHGERAMAGVTIFPGHAGPVAITIELETPDERPLAATAVSVTLSHPDSAVEPATAQAQRTDDGRWRAKMTAPVAGRWTLGLGILVADSDKISVEAPILIK